MSAYVVDFYAVADAYGPVGDEKDAGEDIGDGFLGGEAQGDADDAGTGQKRRDLDLIHLQHEGNGGEEDNDPQELPREIDHAVVNVVRRGGGQAFHPAHDDPSDEEVGGQTACDARR